MPRSLVVVLLLGLACVAVGGRQTQNNSELANSYELYSWRGCKEGWNFSLLVPTNRTKTAEEIFDENKKICGLNNLKHRISEIPSPARLVWMKNPNEGTAVKGTERAVFPPDGIMEEVKRFAATRHVEVIWSK